MVAEIVIFNQQTLQIIIMVKYDITTTPLTDIDARPDAATTFQVYTDSVGWNVGIL